MHAIILVFAAVLLALWPARIGAQCDRCEGDFNGDGRVTIDELVTAVNNALNDCPAPGPRFIDNGDGTITDTNTRLQWEKKDSYTNPDVDVVCPGSSTCANPHDADNRYTWSDASSIFIAELNTANFAGHADWRLPSLTELQSLVDYGRTNPAIDPVFNTACVPDCTLTTCSCTALDNYWSSTPMADLPENAWNVEFIYGVPNPYEKTLTYFVRAVRSGA